MAQHRALGPACGARGIKDRGQIIGATRDGLKCGVRVGQISGQRAGAVPCPSVITVASPGQRGQLVQPRRIANQHTRGGVVDKIGDLGAGIGGVQRQKDPARQHGAQIQLHSLKRLFHLHGHTIAGLQPQRLKFLRQLLGALKQLGIGHIRQTGPRGEYLVRGAVCGMGQTADKIVRGIHGLTFL